ncbi:NAD(P)-binding protein [Aspergillus cavernicola]|uniref:NAD(P)-binding protein n=1 Tax=Aspergillus cavernicola TaxID=176166 RepID=A0ABR4HYJ6_9EURO
MPSYVVTGASRGIGWEFLRQLSNDPSNTVVAIVRDKSATEKRVLEELNARPNIHVLHANLTDYNSLKAAAEESGKITGGSLDYLIANAGLISAFDRYDPIGVLGENPEALEADLLASFQTNVIGQIHLFNLFMPQVLAGNTKKVIALASGHADLSLVQKFHIDLAASYTISKAALNMAVAKFHAQYSRQGVLFLSLSPGMVDTGLLAGLTDEQMKSLGGMVEKFMKYAPDFKGPSTPEESVRDMLSVIEGASVEKGDGGAFISHKGDQKWI